MSLSVGDRLLLQALKRLLDQRLLERIEALEAQVAARPLAKLNAARARQSGRLDQAIAAVLAEHPGLRAKEVGKALERAGFSPLPTERTLRLHLARSRGKTQ